MSGEREDPARKAQRLSAALDAAGVHPDDALAALIEELASTTEHLGHERTWMAATFATEVERLRTVLTVARATAVDMAATYDAECEKYTAAAMGWFTELVTRDVARAADRMAKARAPLSTGVTVLLTAAALMLAAVGGRYSGVREVQAVVARDGGDLVSAGFRSGSAAGAAWTELAQLNGDPAGSVAACVKAGGLQRTADGKAWCAVPFYVGSLAVAKR